jgi:hypothetical protein
MAGSKVIIRKKLRASSLTEAVVAMVIMMLVFGIAMMIYTNIIRLSLSVKKLRAQAVAEDVLLRAVNTGAEEGRSEQIDEYRIEQTARPFGTEKALVVIQVRVFDDNQQQLAQLQQIIIHEGKPE